jgi:hypothetical protein
MSIKIINKPQSYTPVTVELTFETREQLAAFVYLYGNPYDVSKSCYSINQPLITTMGLRKDQLEMALESTIDYGSWSKLNETLKEHS